MRTVAIMVAANLVPLIGVLFLGWSVATVLIVYWLENGVVGFMNIPRILFASGTPNTVAAGMFGRAWNVMAAVFFAFHYGLFWLVHGIFVFVLMGISRPGFPEPLRAVVGEPSLLIAVLALILSHGTDLVVHYFGRGDFRTATPAEQAVEPYPRMLVLHVTIVVGAFAIAFLGQPVALVAVLVVAKTVLDVSLDARRRALR
jgi:hypothetical protein